ncbi:uncharacterized protein CTRU02_213875 [Colletotrichum truncatum]|uniref:Uncharacterized protein n=1 Tax=Colletotrichum truncatum TaxID=5467 RepID=A0ACC3YGX8_COLTU|nr:uncharacterized protein CTRU02_12896 [Colletotrichum truncatum]KAF6784129.1 hypothetical protein CTRU02_12896 [Colletotrichum truncatum]
MASYFPWSKTKTEESAYESLRQGDNSESEAEMRLEAVMLAKKTRSRKRLLISLGVNLLLFASLVALYSGIWSHQRPKRLLPSPVPQFSQHVRTFRLDPLFLSLPSEESNAAWEALPGPNGRGFINLEPNNGFDFPDKIAGLSVFHQLHCLGALRKFMWEVIYEKVDAKALLQKWPENVTSPTYDQAIHGLWHIAHCFDYLRQAVQCSGDTSLEFVSENTGRAVVDGLDYPHECKNWDEIWDYASEFA